MRCTLRHIKNAPADLFPLTDGWRWRRGAGKKSSPNESGTNYDALFGRGRDALVTSCRVYLSPMFAKTSLQKFYSQDFFSGIRVIGSPDHQSPSK